MRQGEKLRRASGIGGRVAATAVPAADDDWANRSPVGGCTLMHSFGVDGEDGGWCEKLVHVTF